jgi:hypothetical protein
MSSHWSDVLDEIEARIDLAEQGQSISFAPPAGLGPMPQELAPRAEALLTRSALVEAALTERAEDLRAQLRRIPRRQAGHTTTNRFDIQA